MAELKRFGVSLEAGLLAAFDQYCSQRGYGNRSEAIRDLIRHELVAANWDSAGVCGGTLTMVYDHHKHDLARRLMAIQHEHHDVIVASMHVHLDHNNCMETLVLKGMPDAVAKLAQQLAVCRGVKYSAFNRAPSGKELD